MSTNYTAKDITVLEGLEPVRKRPGMYIGGVGSAGLHHLVWEILDNAIDEAMNGYASNIRVTLHKDGSSITIEDDGRGIPVDVHPKTKKSALEVIFTVLHAGGKFETGNYKTSGGLHGVGASVVNALARELKATVRRDGSQWEMSFKQGKPQGPLKKQGAARGSGTTVFFRPDSTIFPKIEFDASMIRERLAPSASRTAISRRRAVPLASRRLARLTQAITSRTPTAMRSAVRLWEISVRIADAPVAPSCSSSR